MMHKSDKKRAKKAGARKLNMARKARRDGVAKTKRTARVKKNDVGVKFTWGAKDTSY